MNSLPHLLALPLWLIGKTLDSHSKDGGFNPELWYFFCLFNFFLVKITRNYWVIIFFVAIFGLQCQYIGKSTASNVKHSRFSRKKFAVFFRILSQSASSAYVEFLGVPPSSIMLKFASLSYETVAGVLPNREEVMLLFSSIFISGK